MKYKVIPAGSFFTLIYGRNLDLWCVLIGLDFLVAGSITHTSKAPPRATKIVQPRGWEGGDSSTSTSAWSSDASASLAAAASMGVDDGGPSGGGRVLSGGKTGVSVAGLNSLDREFQRVLKAGVDVFKHPCENKNANESIIGVF